MSIDLRHMRHFVAVAEVLHFGRAAKALRIAQPPLSQSIRRLEADLGVTLFIRSRRGVQLTDAGAVLLREARATLAQVELATKLVRRVGEAHQEVRVGFVGPALYRFLPDALARFAEAHPDILVRLNEQPSPQQVTGLLAGDIDVAFLSGAFDQIENCEVLVAERAELVAVFPADWPLAARASIRLADLAPLPFILPPAQKFTGGAADILGLFTKSGIAPTITQESTHAHTTLSLVGAGLGYSLITGTASLTRPRNVAFIPIEDFGIAPQWTLSMVWQSAHLTAAARIMTDFMAEYIAAHPENQGFTLPATIGGRPAA